jgi:hypothetical protein
VVDPEIIRGLGVGQTAYVHQGGVTNVQVKRLVAAPAALSRVPAAAPAPDPEPPRTAPAAAPPPPPRLADVTAFLDDAFGSEAGTPSGRPGAEH